MAPQSMQQARRCAPLPLVNLLVVLEGFWEEYAYRRQAGLDAEPAAMDALAVLLPPEELDDIVLMLRGDLHQMTSIGRSFDGKALFSALIEAGDTYYQKAEALGTL